MIWIRLPQYLAAAVAVTGVLLEMKGLNEFADDKSPQGQVLPSAEPAVSPDKLIG